MPTHLKKNQYAAIVSRRVILAGLMLVWAVTLPYGALAQDPVKAVPVASVSANIVGAFDRLFNGPSTGRRAVHSNGLLCEGSFAPAPGAAALSRAEHLRMASVPVLVRFSNFAAIPGLPDGSPLASPRGMAIKFQLPNGEDTDIVAHSYDGFPAATPEDFLQFLRALPDPAALQAYVAGHLAARRFLDDPKPAPASYGTETYFGVNAFRFVNGLGQSRYGRYRILPGAGSLHLSAVELSGRAPDFLAIELRQRLQQGPVEFRVLVQLATEDDLVEDGSASWPADRSVVELGRLVLRALVPADDERQAGLVFVPTNLVGGIEPSKDPMLLTRTQAYRISADRRLDEH